MDYIVHLAVPKMCWFVPLADSLVDTWPPKRSECCYSP